MDARLIRKNIKAVTDMLNQKPCTLGEVRRPPDLLAYYRRYINSIAKTAQSLYELLKNPTSISLNQVPKAQRHFQKTKF